jgi:hypothetical protein
MSVWCKNKNRFFTFSRWLQTFEISNVIGIIIVILVLIYVIRQLHTDVKTLFNIYLVFITRIFWHFIWFRDCDLRPSVFVGREYVFLFIFFYDTFFSFHEQNKTFVISVFLMRSYSMDMVQSKSTVQKK